MTSVCQNTNRNDNVAFGSQFQRLKHWLCRLSIVTWIGLFPAVLAAQDMAPALVAYSTPVVKEAQAIKKGRTMNLRLEWRRVSGASRYQVQVSKLLTFKTNVHNAVVTKAREVVRKMKPGIYFWRVRAMGKNGKGSFCQVQILDATRSTVPKRARAKRPPKVTPPMPTEKDLKMRIVWRKPVERSVSTEKVIMLEGVATRGTEIRIEGGTSAIVRASFSIPYTLHHGKNDIQLTATLDDEKKEMTRVVYYAEPSKLDPIRERFGALQMELKEIDAIRRELSSTIRTLERRIEKTKDKAMVHELREELNHITTIQTEIEMQLDRAFKEMEGLLGI